MSTMNNAVTDAPPVPVSEKPHRLCQCELCPLQDRMREGRFAPTAGPAGARVAVVSRSPGVHDTRAKAPFSGPSGRVLDHLLKMNGYSRKDILLTNVVLCETDTVPDKAIASCKPRLDAEVKDAEILISAGSEATLAFTGQKIGQARGRRINSGNRTVIATYNPAIVLRESGVYPDLVSDFRRALNPPTKQDYPRVYYTESISQARGFAREILTKAAGGIVTCDIEASGLSHRSKLISVSFSPCDRESYVFGRGVVQTPEGIELLNELLSNRTVRWNWWNGKYDTQVLRDKGIDCRIDEDGMLLSYSLDERQGVHSLDYATQNVLGWEDYTSDDIKQAKVNGWRENADIEFRYLKGAKVIKAKCGYGGFSDWPAAYKYNGYDSGGSHLCTEELSRRVKEDGTESAYRRILIPAANALSRVESRGILLDTDYLTELEVKHATPRLNELTFIGEGITGSHINLNSPLQVAAYLYDQLRITNPLWRPGKERSVDALVRDAIKREYSSPTLLEFVDVLDEYKKLSKLRSNYLTGLAEKVDGDGRIRTSLLIHGTETGRLSSRKPNLQNISRNPDALTYPSIQEINVRRAFYAEDGHVILQADYSQAELRCAAVLSGDPRLLEVYRAGRDLHDEVARTHYGADFTKNQRVAAKTVNFGILYGMGAGKLARQLHIEWKVADALIKGWWRQFPDVAKWVSSVHKQTRAQGELMSAAGRKRRFHLITNDNLDHTLKEAVNFHIQSTASDLTLYSLIKLVEMGLPVILSVHDSILLEVPEDKADATSALVKEVMESVATELLGDEWGQIPFSVDAGYAHTWGDI